MCSGWDTPMIDYYNYTYLGDSIINGVQYKHIFGKHTSWGDTSLFGRIEGNKVFLLDIPHTTNIPEEVLLVDYGWNIGDTVDNYYFQSVLQPFAPVYDDKRWVIDAGVEYLQGVATRYVVLQYKQIRCAGGSWDNFYDTLMVQKFNERLGPWDNALFWILNWGESDDFYSHWTTLCYQDGQINLNFNPPGVLCTGNLSYENFEAEYQPMIAPNPVSNELTINLQKPLKQNTRLCLFDGIGRLVAEEVLYQGQLTSTINISQLASGLYIVNLSDAVHQPWTIKVVKK